MQLLEELISSLRAKHPAVAISFSTKVEEKPEVLIGAMHGLVVSILVIRNFALTEFALARLHCSTEVIVMSFTGLPFASAHLAVSARPPFCCSPQGSPVGGRLIATFVLEILCQRHLAQSEDKNGCNIYSCACVNNYYY